MKIVLDTNVFVSGVFWSGSPQQVLMLWAENKIDLLVTKKILNEYLRILHKIDHKGNLAQKWGAFVLENSIILEDKELVQVLFVDLKKNIYLQAIPNHGKLLP